MVRLLVFFLLMFFMAVPAAQASDYAQPTWANLVRTLIRFGALGVSDDKIIDEYAAISECDIYRHFFQDDFKWNQIRGLIRQSIQTNIATYPIDYYYDAKMQLDRYDFQQKVFNFTDKTTVQNVNSFILYHEDGLPCDKIPIKNIPTSYRAVLDSSIYFTGLPLSEKDAQALLQQMRSDNNTDRVVYARFNLRIVYVEPMHKNFNAASRESEYAQSGPASAHSVRLDVHLDSIDFYEDPDRTRLIYSYHS